MKFDPSTRAYSYAPITEQACVDAKDSISEASEASEVSETNDLSDTTAIIIPKRRSQWRGSFIAVAIALLLITLYSWAILHVASNWWQRKILHGPTVVDTPIRPWIQYQPKKFAHLQWASEYPLVGQPSDELDARWVQLEKTFYTEVPAEYLKKMGRLDEGVQLENGNYAATYSVMHLLHCVKRIHQSYYSDRYFPNMTEREESLQLEHNLHCLQMILQAVMCNADVVPITTVWLDNQPLPSGNFDVAHECVNWELLKEGMAQHRVDPWKPGTFVHPIYGQTNALGTHRDRIQFGEIGNILHRLPSGEWDIDG